MKSTLGRERTGTISPSQELDFLNLHFKEEEEEEEEVELEVLKKEAEAKEEALEVGFEKTEDLIFVSIESNN